MPVGEKEEALASRPCQRPKLFAAAVVLCVFLARRWRCFHGKPALTAQPFHGGGEGFVEGGVVLGIDDLMRQLVEDQARQFAFGVIDEGVE